MKQNVRVLYINLRTLFCQAYYVIVRHKIVYTINIQAIVVIAGDLLSFIEEFLHLSPKTFVGLSLKLNGSTAKQYFSKQKKNKITIEDITEHKQKKTFETRDPQQK